MRILPRTSKRIGGHHPTKARGNRALTRRWVGTVLPVVLLLSWEWGARLGAINGAFFPPPSELAPAFIALFSEGRLSEHLLATTSRVVLGLVIGALVGFIVGILMGMTQWLRHALEPLLSGLYTVPKIALIPIFFSIFGLGNRSILALIAFSVFFYVWVYTMDAVLRVPESYLDAAVAMGSRRRHILWDIVVPASLPSVFAGLRVAAAVSILVGMTAEFIVGSDGLGWLIFHSRALFKMPQAFVGILCVALLGYILQAFVVATGKRLSRWSAQPNLRPPRFSPQS